MARRSARQTALTALRVWRKEKRFADSILSGLLANADLTAPDVLANDAPDVLTGVKQSLAAVDSRPAMRPWWRFEAVKARRVESSAARSASAVTVPTDADAATFERLGARRVVVVLNGVDLQGIEHRLPPPGAHIVLIGYFAWRPNAEAGLELCREIVPRIRARVASARVTLVGAMPPPELLAQAGPAVELAGGVEATLPYLRAARVTVMPVRAGGGSRMKVLEALAVTGNMVQTSRPRAVLV